MTAMAAKRINPSTNLPPLLVKRKVALMEAGVTGADVARAAGKTKAAVSLVLHDRIRSPEIEDAFARLVGLPVESLWPHRASIPPAE